MSVYHTSNQMAGTPQAVSSSAKTITQLTAATATLKRALVNEIIMGAAEAPNATDCPINFDAVRQSSLGTGTTATPSPTDSTFAAAGIVGTVNMTAEPTTGVVLGNFALNQRASMRWAAVPGNELVIPATNINGIGVRAKSPNYILSVTVSMFHVE